jgi:hypothetical protein
MNNVDTNEEWITCFDPNTNSPYYYNSITGITQWELPEEFNSPSSHFFTPPGGIRPQNSSDEIIPSLVKVKSKSGIKIGSFRSQKKILPVIETEANSSQGENESGLLQDDFNLQRKSRPTVKLKGTPLLHLKRALSNQQLEIESEITNDPPPLSSPTTTHNNESQANNSHSLVAMDESDAVISSEQLPSNQFQSVKQAISSTSRDYIAMAHKYQRFFPYSNHFFDHNTKCILCSFETPNDIFFPCNHRCVCRNCLSLPPFSPQFNLTLMDQKSSSEKIFCPLCNLLVKQILPINGKGTEETEYWDWVLESGKNSLPALDQQFLEHFSANTSLILEKCSHYTSQSDLDPQNSSSSRGGHEDLDGKNSKYDVGKGGEGGESLESEEGETFPQFSLDENRRGFHFCCGIQ